MRLAVRIASRHVSAAPWLMAGVMPVQWNHEAPSNAFSQSIMPGRISDMAECALSYTTLLGRATAPVSRK